MRPDPIPHYENDGTGLYYFRARYYYPALGRFVGEDPAQSVAESNSYIMLGNDPLNYVDPLGLWQVTVTFALPTTSPAAQFTFGNSTGLNGQWNFGAKVGYGQGSFVSASFDPNSQGCKPSGVSRVEGKLSVRGGLGKALGLGAEITSNREEPWGVAVTGNVNLPIIRKYSLGADFNPYNPDNFPKYQQAVDVYGESAFLGVGASYYGSDCRCKK